uniref:Uncharacterized protein n=1 Tax=Eutreptiella gymnastica TaxID=73025 RepID=A0A7S4FU00_9EUGL
MPCPGNRPFLAPGFVRLALRIMRTWQARVSGRERRKNNQFSFRNYFERHPSIHHPSSFSPWVGPTNNIRSQLFSALLSKRYHKQKRQDKCLVDQENRWPKVPWIKPNKAVLTKGSFAWMPW